jgi:hypothetical protein
MYAQARTQQGTQAPPADGPQPGGPQPGGGKKGDVIDAEFEDVK